MLGLVLAGFDCISLFCEALGEIGVTLTSMIASGAQEQLGRVVWKYAEAQS